MEDYDRNLTKKLEDAHDLYKTKISNISRPGTSPNEMVGVYNEWVKSYEEDNCKAGYTGPILTAKYAGDCIPAGLRADIRILDIGAGTGFGAIELKKLGFERIDAIDPCSAMLDIARDRGLYENYYEEFLSDAELPIPENKYDCITGSGCFSEGHVPPEALKEMIRLVKPGGFVILTTRLVLIQTSEYYKPLEPLMAQLELEGKWQQVARDVWPRFYFDKEAVVYCYRVL